MTAYCPNQVDAYLRRAEETLGFITVFIDPHAVDHPEAVVFGTDVA